MTDWPVHGVVVDPPGSQWAQLARSHFDRIDDSTRTFRRQLGLATDQPIIMTGHQATFWHCGVLAKYLAADAVGRAIHCEIAWLVADQDIHEHGPVMVPVRDGDGHLQILGTILMGCAGTQIATASCAPFTPAEPAINGLEYALPSVGEGIHAIVGALLAHRDEGSAARQILTAASALLDPIIPSRTAVFASELASTDLFGDLLDQIRRDPERVVGLYNSAAHLFGDSGVTLMRTDGPAGGIEIPLWRLRPNQARQRVFSTDAVANIQELAPRAVLMSALVRLAGCDLFIQGTGGQSYDRVTERWVGDWLDEPLAPAAVVTGDVLLPLHESNVTDEDVASAVWRAHSARHNPGLIGLGSIAREKDRLVQAIISARSAGDDPAPLFARLHMLLDAYRIDNAEKLTALDDGVHLEARLAAERGIAQDRTWAFPLHEQGVLEHLRERIESSFQPCARPCAVGGGEG